VQDDLSEWLKDVAMRLDLAMAVKIGAMDSQNRVHELTRGMQESVAEIAQEIRARA
jgi:hypothetical protein